MTGSSTNNRMARNGIDWGSVAIFFSLMLLGWLNIYAAVFDDAARAGFSMDSRYGSQLIWMGVSVLAAVVIMLIDEIYYHILAYPSYILMLAVLLATLFIGTEVNGAKSWLRLGGPHGRHPAPERRRFGHRVRLFSHRLLPRRFQFVGLRRTGDGGLPLRLLLPLEPCDAARGGHRYLYPHRRVHERRMAGQGAVSGRRGARLGRHLSADACSPPRASRSLRSASMPGGRN